MKVAIAAVTSIDGKPTKHHKTDIYTWVSPEDQENFRSLIAKHQVIVMGSGTYETIKDSLKLTENTLRIVLTSRPGAFQDQSVKGQLEFSKEIPTQLVDRLSKEGFVTMLIVGGAEMMSDFLQNKLVDGLYLTIEPRIFGTGQALLDTVPLDTRLKLTDYRLLNKTGTMFLTYEVMS